MALPTACKTLVLNDMLTDAVSTGRLLSKNTRPQNVVYSGLLAASVAFIQHTSLVRCVACYILILCLYAVATSLNNRADLHTDTLNKRADNPLVSQLLKQRELTLFIFIMLCVVAALQLLLAQPYSSIISIAYIVLAYAYSDKRLTIQSRGLWGTILLGVCYSALPLLLGAYQRPSNVHTGLIWISSWATLSTIPIVLAKDYKDYLGDKLTNKLTPLVRHGITKVRLIAYTTIALSSVAYLALATVYKVGLLMLVTCGLICLIYVLLTICLHLKLGNLQKAYKNTLLFALLVLVTLLMQASRA